MNSFTTTSNQDADTDSAIFSINEAGFQDLIPYDADDAPQVKMPNMPFGSIESCCYHASISAHVYEKTIKGDASSIPTLIMPLNQGEIWIRLLEPSPKPIWALTSLPLRDLYEDDEDDVVPADDGHFEGKRMAELSWPVLGIAVPVSDFGRYALPQNLLEAVTNIVEKLHTLKSTGAVVHTNPQRNLDEVLQAVERLEHLGARTVGFDNTLNSILQKRFYRFVGGKLFSLLEKGPESMTLAERVASQGALGFWIERYTEDGRDKEIRYYYFSNDLRRKYGDVLLHRQRVPAQNDSGGKCYYCSERFEDEQGYLRVMW